MIITKNIALRIETLKLLDRFKFRYESYDSAIFRILKNVMDNPEKMKDFVSAFDLLKENEENKIK